MLGYYLWRHQKVLLIGFVIGVVVYVVFFFSLVFRFIDGWWMVCMQILLAPLQIFSRLIPSSVEQTIIGQQAYLGGIFYGIINGFIYLFVFGLIHGLYRTWRVILKAFLKFFFDIDISTR